MVCGGYIELATLDGMPDINIDMNPTKAQAVMNPSCVKTVQIDTGSIVHYDGATLHNAANLVSIDGAHNWMYQVLYCLYLVLRLQELIQPTQ